jgi:PKD repeat protein
VRLFERSPGAPPFFPIQHPITIDLVSYGDSSPWPVEADGFGHSIELLNISLDNDFADNWRGSLTERGSPGILNTINLPPVARLNANPLVGRAPLDVEFDPLLSSDPEGADLLAAWNFGDGAIDAGFAIKTHRYDDPGTYVARLTVNDSINPAVAVEQTIVVVAAPVFIRGDANDDGKIDIVDAMASLFAVFFGTSVNCEMAVDADDDTLLTVYDALLTLRYLFLSGPAPSAPFPECAVDPTLDGLSCSRQTSCE